MTSIRFRLLFTLIGMFIFAWSVVVFATYGVARSRIETLLDAHLEHDARVLLALADHVPQDENPVPIMSKRVDIDTGMYKKVLAFQVWKGNQLLLQSEQAPAFDLPGAPGYRNATFDDEVWRMLTVRGPAGKIWVQVGESFPVRTQLVYEIVHDALYPLVLGVPILAVIVWAGVGRGLEPLKEVARQVAERSPSNLVPVNLRQVPVEINVLTKKLNELLSLLQDAFGRERQFTADAAHEIRTPLAGIKTHAQLALVSTSDEQRSHALQQIVAGVDRTSHLVEQLLTLARLDRESLQDEFTQVDLVVLAKDMIRESARESEVRQVHLGLAEGSRGTVRGNTAALRILLRNLIDNGVRYTKPGGFVQVEVKQGRDETELTVTDNGPGIQANDRLRVFDRFYRGHSHQVQGCGLGLSIVRRIANLHAAHVELDDPGNARGLCVRVRFPDAGKEPVQNGSSKKASVPLCT